MHWDRHAFPSRDVLGLAPHRQWAVERGTSDTQALMRINRLDLRDRSRRRHLRPSAIDLKVRLAGLALIAVSAASFILLTHLVRLPAGEQSMLPQLAVAAVCVLAQMVGTSMLFLGQALFAPALPPVRVRLFVAGDLLEI